MQTSPFVLPKPVGKALGRLPALPGSMLFVTGLNLALAKQLAPDVTEMLVGKKLRLCVLDAQWAFDFEWKNNRFVACKNPGTADLTISASAYDFVLLARRQEDPDTLFFSRRLAMEGDTELGLLVKNTIDAIELPVFNAAQLHPRHVMAQAREHLMSRLAALRPR
ncbi:SCP2 sterol-binding domain-containing protein [Rhodoferax sp. U2-2l]|uniref:ubiquinone anaerobic biosynthesis accessory factor UbiT n=1 Tax=Rhodoferax sp. U2-2l TaxID=2884000 RepID=UPI001D09B0A7|nr:SCP2 sterol-binding domain-containing protein [Rhodoferax sp. U2-2l]MCB8746249.1 SCP2 sterol-binding domain-containing protein [Rhodoferax sp. U2-2l]